MASVLLVCLASYLLGSIPNGLVFGKLIWHVDLREYGSHNIGATNAWRTLGKGPGFLIFLLDFLKGALSVGLAEVFAPLPLVMVIAGILAIVGHSCSLFLHFKGGKGVATGLGVIAMLMPLPSLIVFLVWLAIVMVTKYVSLGSCIAAHSCRSSRMPGAIRVPTRPSACSQRPSSSSATRPISSA